MKKSIIAAGAASIALAAMPIIGVFAADANQMATDTINVTVTASCTFTAGSGTATYAVEGTNSSATVLPIVEGGNNTHDFTVFCNNNKGYTVSANAEDLSATGITDKFAYAASLPPANTATSAWTAAFTQPDGGSLTLAPLTAAETDTDIVTLTEASATGGESFTATYSAYIGTETPSGTYSGTIAYTLAPRS